MTAQNFGAILRRPITNCCLNLICFSLLCSPTSGTPQVGGPPAFYYNQYNDVRSGQLQYAQPQQPAPVERVLSDSIHFPDMQHVRQMAPPQQSKAGGGMHFAWDMFKTVILPQQGNVAICPILPQILLASLYDAADPDAKAELQSSLKASSQELKPLIHTQLTIANRSAVNHLDYAMAYFLGPDVQISRNIYEKAAQDGVSFQRVNFVKRNEAAATANRWVTEKTRGVIREIVAPGTLDATTRLLMASVIYFKGQWKYQFTKTEPGYFESFPGSDKTSRRPVPMMYQLNKFRYGETNSPDGRGMRWIELPYEGSNGLAMILMLPKVRHQLQQSAEQLSKEDVSKIIASLSQSRSAFKTHLYVPRMSVFSTSTLVPALKSLGLKSIFERSSALSGLSNEQLVVRDVTQRTLISIDEQGTTATSAASLSFVALSAALPPPTINFVVDEPFLLMIVDKVNEYPLFIAKVVTPETN